MKILIVAMAHSIHAARWISQISDMGWDIHLFPSYDTGDIHASMKNLVIHPSFYSRNKTGRMNDYRGIPLYYRKMENMGKALIRKFFPLYRVFQLAELIKRLRPDVIHSMEFQQGCYLTLDAKKRIKGDFPPWIVSNWGSDIYLFGRLPEHKKRIKSVLSQCDYYHCECQRDVDLALAFGFNKTLFPVCPNGGGFDVGYLLEKRGPLPASKRKKILLKGYQSWAGRSLIGLRAIELCADVLRGFRVVIYLAGSDIVLAARLLSERTGIEFEFITEELPHDEMIEMHGLARISIGLCISDGISTSLLEAMIMGSFPIQSHTSCGNEWIHHGENGYLVHPESPEEVAKAIQSALFDDCLVDNAAEINERIAKERLDLSIVKPMAIDMYQKAAARWRNQ